MEVVGMKRGKGSEFNYILAKLTKTNTFSSPENLNNNGKL